MLKGLVRTKHNNTCKVPSKQQVVVDYSLHNPHIDNPIVLRMGDTAMSSRLGIVMKSLATPGRKQKEKASGLQDDEAAWYTDISKNRYGNRYSDEVVAAALQRCLPTTDIHYELRSPRKESLCFRQPVLVQETLKKLQTSFLHLPTIYSFIFEKDSKFLSGKLK